MNSRSDRFSAALQKVPPSGIRRFFDLVIGRSDIISLGVGEPDFETPWVIREEAYYHLEQGHTSYTSNWGLPELRSAIAGYVAKYGLQYDSAREILVTVGVSEAVDVVLRSILNPGDEVIVAEPCYVSYRPLVELCGARVVSLDTGMSNMIPTAAGIERIITDKTKAVLICSPSNPTGRMIPHSELQNIAAVIQRHQLWAISDEVYSELVYDDNRHYSIGGILGMKDYTIVMNGFSKAFAMTGWRIGYICCPADLMAQIVKLHQYNTICAPIFSQYAALEGLRSAGDEVAKMRRSYQQRRNFMYKSFVDMNLPVTEPEGAFYMFPDIRCTGRDSETFATELLNRYNVAVVPGNVFGAGGEGFIRCCYATEIGKMKTALERIASFVTDCRNNS